MCDAGAVVGGLIGLAGSFMDMEEHKDYSKDIKQEAMKAYKIDMDALGVKTDEVDDAAELEDFERQRQGAREAARVRTAASEAGVFGNSQLRELRDAAFQESYDRGITESNRKSKQKQIELEKKKVQAGLQSRLNEADRAKPDGLMSGLSIASAGLAGAAQGYETGKSLKSAWG